MFGSLNRCAHQTMGERQMNEGFEQFLATIIEQCLDEHDMQQPLVVRTVGDNGSVLVAGFNEGTELVVLTKHCENDTFTLPIKVTVVSRNNRTVRLVIERAAISAGYTDYRSRKGISAHAIGPLVWLTPPKDPAVQRSGLVRPHAS